MQRPHRRAHLRLWVLLTLVVGTLFILAVMLRQERPVDTQQIQQSLWLPGSGQQAGGFS